MRHFTWHFNVVATLLGAIGGASAEFCAAQTNTSCGSWLAGMGLDDMDAGVSLPPLC